MPYFMDRHEFDPDAAARMSAEDVAKAHMMDAAVQERFGVRFLSYWFDKDRQTNFCLIDAPSAELAEQVHAESHGGVANKIIPVDETAVDLFLGRVEDPGQHEAPHGSAFRTILFTDIEASTAMTQRFGDDAAVQLLELHDDIVRSALAANGGRQVKHTGDGIMACFPAATAALEAAIGIQLAVRDRGSANPEAPLRVSIGLGAGEPVARGDDLFGAAVQLASRLCDAAQPGEILVSSTVRELALGKQFEFSASEELELKGFPEPMRACRLTW